jgi:hypothetical protein
LRALAQTELDDPCVRKCSVWNLSYLRWAAGGFVHSPFLIYLIGLIWANRIALREGWGSMEILLQGVWQWTGLGPNR